MILNFDCYNICYNFHQMLFYGDVSQTKWEDAETQIRESENGSREYRQASLQKGEL